MDRVWEYPGWEYPAWAFPVWERLATDVLVPDTAVLLIKKRGAFSLRLSF